MNFRSNYVSLPPIFVYIVSSLMFKHFSDACFSGYKQRKRGFREAIDNRLIRNI